MITMEDFTSMPAGCEVSMAGRVAACPRCGRNGIESRECDLECFVHTQETDVHGDGMRIEPVDRCLLASEIAS